MLPLVRVETSIKMVDGCVSGGEPCQRPTNHKSINAREGDGPHGQLRVRDPRRSEGRLVSASFEFTHSIEKKNCSEDT